MTKLLDCPYCEAKKVPVRNDAVACSPKCRQRKKRLLDKKLTTKGESDEYI